MSEDTPGQAPPIPIVPPPPTPIKEPQADTLDVLEYYAYNAADRLKHVKGQIEEREKAYFNLSLIETSLNGNPEEGKHHEVDEESNDPTKRVPCQCRDDELKRVQNLMRSMVYAIGKLKAVHAALA